MTIYKAANGKKTLKKAGCIFSRNNYNSCQKPWEVHRINKMEETQKKDCIKKLALT
ncbi:hypothetical protein GCM10020331_033270 [Ectobacillus funiculus]